MNDRGMPVLNGRGKGDLFVHIEVETPTNLTKEQAQSLSQFAKMRGEKQ